MCEHDDNAQKHEPYKFFFCRLCCVLCLLHFSSIALRPLFICLLSWHNLYKRISREGTIHFKWCCHSKTIKWLEDEAIEQILERQCGWQTERGTHWSSIYCRLPQIMCHFTIISSPTVLDCHISNVLHLKSVGLFFHTTTQFLTLVL